MTNYNTNDNELSKRPETFYRIDNEQMRIWEAAIPIEMQQRNQWLVWRYDWIKGRWCKCPYNSKATAKGKNSASATEPKTWNEFIPNMLVCDGQQYDGIGFVLTLESKLIGIDLDHCRDHETGAIAPWAIEILNRINSYAELSPSGKGIRIFARGELPETKTASKTGRKRNDREIYWTGRYLTITGHVVEGYNTIHERSAELLQWFNETFPEAEPVLRTPENTGTVLSDEKVLEIAFRAGNGAKIQALYKGDASAYGGDKSSADLGLLKTLAFYTQDENQLDRLFRGSGRYRDKWERYDYRKNTIEKAIASCTTTYKPDNNRNIEPFF